MMKYILVILQCFYPAEFRFSNRWYVKRVDKKGDRVTVITEISNYFEVKFYSITNNTSK